MIAGPGGGLTTRLRARLPNAYEAAARAFDAVARASPLAALRLARAAGSAMRAVSGPTAREVRRAFGPIATAGAGAIAREIAETSGLLWGAKRIAARGGVAALAPLLREVDLGGLERVRAEGEPAIFVFIHAGCVAVGVWPWVLAQRGIEAVVLARGRGRRAPPPGIETFDLDGDLAARALAMKRAVERLRAGGVVIVAIDGRRTDARSFREVTVLGRRLPMAPGPAALARLTGAPIVPIESLFTAEGTIRLRAREPVRVPSRDEAAIAAALARTWEELLRAAPGQVWRSAVWRLLVSPRAAGAGAAQLERTIVPSASPRRSSS